MQNSRPFSRIKHSRKKLFEMGGSNLEQNLARLKFSRILGPFPEYNILVSIECSEMECSTSEYNFVFRKTGCFIL